MKEQLLHLDPHDDFISARDKMGWVQTERVLLIWPAHGRVLSRPLDLVLLHRHAHRLGAHLAVVTTDAAVRQHAEALGLPVFGSVKESRRNRWRSRLPALRPERMHPPLDPVEARRQLSRRARVLPSWARWTLNGVAFALGLGALLALAYALIPSATITLSPAVHQLSASVEVIGDPDLTDLAYPDRLPARTVRAEVEAEGRITTTGVRDVPSQAAVGTVVFSNLIGIPAVIPQGTGVRTTSGTPARFVLTETVTIEGRLGATVAARVVAENPGPAGNVGSGLINAIDGPLGLQLAVTNPLTTTGGSVAQRAAVSDGDRQRLRNQLMEELRQKALAAIQAQLQPGELLAEDSVTVEEVVAGTYDASPGDIADTLGLALRVAVTGLAVNENQARDLAQAALEQTVPAEQRLVAATTAFDRGPLTFSAEVSQVRLTLRASGVATSTIDREAVRRFVQGQPIARVRDQLPAALPLAGPPQIEVRPAWYARWAPRLPWMLFRIDVVVP